MRPTAPLACDPPPTAAGALSLLQPELRRWFHSRYGPPTLAQRRAWPKLLAGEALLLSAPTGSGKTWAALIPILNQWSLRAPASAGVRGLYLAPLRALCNDLYYRLGEAFGALKPTAPPRVGLLTGDTPQHWRKRLWANPPELLVTTPESLALLLARTDAGARLKGVEQVVVDELHALAGIKRGADLALCLERLDCLAEKPVQRIGLSATAAPLRQLASWLAGAGPPVAIVAVPDPKPWRLRIEHLDEALAEGAFLATLLEHVEKEVEAARTTLLFTNARSVAERITWALRRRRPDWSDQIAIHHGSLAADQRAAVEGKLQAGELRLCVSSTSLELGVDLGFVDQVLMVHPPGGAGRLLQRLGRSGHRPGGRREGVLYTTSLEELWEAVVTRDGGLLSYLEPQRLPAHPLDVLCQHLLGMAIERPRPLAEAWTLVRQAAPFRELTLSDFACCVDYLTGGGEAAPMPARLRLVDHRLEAVDRRTVRLFRQNAGTITTEHQADIRLADGRSLGSLNSIWADRLEPGDRFLLGGHSLEVKRRGPGELVVEPKGGTPAFSRWMGGTSYMSPTLAERIWRLRRRLKEALLAGRDAAGALLVGELRTEPALAELLIDQAEAQETVSEIPADGLLVESWSSDDGETVFHAFHVPFTAAMAEGLLRVLAKRMGLGPNPGVIIGRLGGIMAASAALEVSPDGLRELLHPEGFERDLDRAMAESHITEIRFGEVAKTGLMLLRQPNGRLPRVGGAHWAGERLLRWLRFAAPRFPLLLQTQREVRQEIHHADRVLAWLRQLPLQPIRQRWLNQASPFAREWFFNPFQAPLQLTEPVLGDALLRIHLERQAAHAAG